MTRDLVKCMKATQKTVDLYKGRVFEDGRADCVQLMLIHARHMGRKIKVPRYRDVSGAAAAMRKLGFETLGQAMDHYFTRIEPHQVLLGDIIEVPGQNGFSSLMIAVGNGRTIGFHESIPFAEILQPVLISGAWRIGQVSRPSTQASTLRRTRAP